MATTTADVVVCGAGIAGISTAYHLAGIAGISKVLVIDPMPPMSVTSDKSTECYRNWWPGPGSAMIDLMNRSIDILEELARESGNTFHLNRRGYLYVTGDPESIPGIRKTAEEISTLGAGQLRIHSGPLHNSSYCPALPDGYEQEPDGADLLIGHDLVHEAFPYLTKNAVAALHVRRAGWLSAQQLGSYLLEQAKRQGAELWRKRVVDVEVVGGRVQRVLCDDGSRIDTPRFVNAGGPMIGEVAGMLGTDLPVFSELHLKIALRDTLGAFPRQAPLLIWTDPQKLPWDEDEKAHLAEDENTRWLLDEFPAGVHGRPEGGLDSPMALMLWTYDIKQVKPTWPIPTDPYYAEVILRGMAAMLPGFWDYFYKFTKPILDGGYYTKTRENRPLIGPLPVEGAFIIGALSGFGIMASSAAGELVSAHVTGQLLPDYAPAFLVERYQDPEYLRMIEEMGSSGQI